MAATLLDELLAAVDAGATPSRAAAEEWARGLADGSAAAHELTLLRQRVEALRPAAAQRVDAALCVVLDAALQHMTERAIDAALNDAVTGLPTRRLYQRDSRRALAGAGRSGRPLSVVMIDVDGLKKVNDRHGHAAGDAHLRAVADALRSAVRDGDGVYRIGGDEFALLLADADEAAAERVMRRFAGPDISWGVATSADGGADGDGLLATADARMYRTRRDRRRPVPPPRPRLRGTGLAAAAAAFAALSTVGLMTVTTGGAGRQDGSPPAASDPRAPASPASVAPVVPQSPADDRAAPPPVTAASAAPAPAVADAAPQSPAVLPPLVLPSLPTLPVPVLTAPPLPLPQPTAGPGTVATVVDETVTLVGETVCSLLC